MAKSITKKENPLLSKNIPQPPTPTNLDESEADKGTESIEQSNIATEHQDSMTFSDQEEKATVEVSLYLRPSQDDKLDDLKREYKRRTRRKISSNQIMRLLIDRASIDNLL